MDEQVVTELTDKIRVIAAIISKNDHRHHDAPNYAGDQRAVDLVET